LSRRRNLEPIIALIDEYLIIIIIILVILYSLYAKGIISLSGFVILVSGILILLAAIMWRVYAVYRRDAMVGPESLIGKTARVVEDLDPEGMVEVEGELWKARSVGGRVPRGARVRVLDYNGLTLIVAPYGAGDDVPMQGEGGA